MAELSIKIINADGQSLAENSSADEVNLVYRDTYKEGDKIIINSSQENLFLHIQIDDGIGSSFVYLTKKEITYNIPFAEKRSSYSPKVFYGNLHLISVKIALPEEIKAYRNLARNVMDQHGETGCFPHASANVETRGEAVFAARNAIDGVKETHSHGSWPYQSWGINMQEDAAFKLEFGRRVCIDKILLYTRADFPHDNWWKEVTVTYSDGTNTVWQLTKSDKAHVLTFEKKEIEWLLLSNLIKADDPSPFPALTEIEVYGMDA